MKKFYVSPNVRVVTVKTNKMMMLVDSWDEEDTGGVDPTPGGQGNFGSKEEEYSYFGW